jgi:hypothetical protein
LSCGVLPQFAEPLQQQIYELLRRSRQPAPYVKSPIQLLVEFYGNLRWMRQEPMMEGIVFSGEEVVSASERHFITDYVSY